MFIPQDSLVFVSSRIMHIRKKEVLQLTGPCKREGHIRHPASFTGFEPVSGGGPRQMRGLQPRR